MPSKRSGPVLVDGAGRTAADIQSVADCQSLIRGFRADIQTIDNVVAKQGQATVKQTSARFYKRLAILQLNSRIEQLNAAI